MGNMTTRTIANATERALSTMYLWGHIQGAPSVDRRIAMSDMVFKDGSGRAGIGVASPLDRLDLLGSLRLRDQTLTTGRHYQLTVTPTGQLQIIDAFDAAARLLITTAGDLEALGHIRPYADNSKNLGSGSFRFSTVYAATGAINTSDERAKTEIGDIPDAWLDAWADVQWQRFKMKARNRWHVGLIAQQVYAAFSAHDLDAFDIGLCCYDEWEEQREPIFENVIKTRLITAVEQEPAGEDEDGNPLFRMRQIEVEEEYEETVDTGNTRVTLEAGDRWGLRYDECQAMEAAWQRREISRLADRLAALESPAQ